MMSAGTQAPRSVVMIRGHRFCPNPLTALDNAFQGVPRRSPSAIATQAFWEVTHAARRLRDEGVSVHLFDDPLEGRPDSVFPNNWMTTHHDGRVALFPMYAANRRTERRADVLEQLALHYRVTDVVDYSPAEARGLFLEGTGAMVLDHTERVAYAARSLRTSPELLARFCTDFGYRPCLFDAVDADGIPIYHTNVMMAVGSELALIASSMIPDPMRRAEILRLLAADGRREVIELSRSQVAAFAGNVLELDGAGDRLLAMSTTALAALEESQRARIERTCRIVALSVPTIELAGGSVRCMLAGIHLTPRCARPRGSADAARVIETTVGQVEPV